VHCNYCYAKRLANGRLKPRYLANSILPTHDEANHEAHHADPFYPRFWPSRIIEPMNKYRRWGKHNAVLHEQSPKGIFVCDMGELFGDWVPREWQEAIFDTIVRCPQHRFYLLTKQPQNLIKFSPFPSNCWVGISVTNDLMFDRAIYHLGNFQAKTKFISIEPFLEPIKVNGWYQFNALVFQWLIVGGQSGRNKFYPPESWIQEIEDACDKDGIPVFEKNNLRETWDKPPRQEMPLVVTAEEIKEEQELADMGLEDYLEGIERDEKNEQ